MRRTDYIYFLIDNSNSMNGFKLGSMNDAITNIIHRLKRNINKKDVCLKIIVMTFSDAVSWSNTIPVELNNFVFVDVQVGGKETKIGEAYRELYEKLLRQEEVWNNSTDETTIIMFSDGISTDSCEDELKLLKQNTIFTKSNRIAFTFDGFAKVISVNSLGDFVSQGTNIIIEDFVALNKMIFEKYR